MGAPPRSDGETTCLLDGRLIAPGTWTDYGYTSDGDWMCPSCYERFVAQDPFGLRPVPAPPGADGAGGSVPRSVGLLLRIDAFADRSYLSGWLVHIALFVVSMCMFVLLGYALSLGSNGVAAGGDPDAVFGSTVLIGLVATTIGIYRARRSQSDQE